MTALIPHYFTAPVEQVNCVWCGHYANAAIHDTSTILAVAQALDLAREEGRQEVRDEIIAQMDIYAPHAVEWWKNFNAILKFDPKGR